MDIEKLERLEKPETIKKLKIISYTVMALLVVVDIIFRFFFHPHEAFWGDKVPGFYAFYGFIACWLILKVSKWLGQVWLMKPEDYYD